MADLLVPFSCFVGWLPAGLPTSDGGVLPHVINPRNPWWSAGSMDLSAPPLDEHGEPTRLDALPWAIGVLERRIPYSLLASDLRVNGALADCTERHSGGSRSGPPAPWWPDLTAEREAGDEDAALRAIVAAALRARVGLAEVSP